eukprot:c10043_g1_i2.p1 GENE.c10043_g1_i2~~c10043_g1_i2.p1  ORF type:complete len:1472 (+),score=346.79 c10043_g1_i2:302-4417(+)
MSLTHQLPQARLDLPTLFPAVHDFLSNTEKDDGAAAAAAAAQLRSIFFVALTILFCATCCGFVHASPVCVLSILLLTPLLPSAAATSVEDGLSHEPWKWDWFNTLVQNVSIPIPDITESFDSVTVTITNGVCKHISIEGIEVDLDTINQLDVNVTGVNVVCDLDYSLKVPVLPKIAGHVTAALAETSVAASLGMEYKDALPYTATLLDCNVAVNISQLHFTGGLPDYLIDLFSDVIKAVLSAELNSRTCGIVKPLIDTNVTQILHTLFNTIDPLMHSPSPTPSPSLPSHLLEFDKSGILALIGSLVSNSGAEAVNALADHFTNNTGTYSLPIGIGLDFDGYMASYNINLDSLTITGLDEFDQISLLQAVGPNELNLRVKLNEIAISIAMSLTVTSKVVPHQVLNYDLTVQTAVSGLELSAVDLLAIQTDVLGNLMLVQSTDLSCLLSSVYSANLTNLNLTFGSLSFGVVGFGDEFNQILNDTAAMVLELVSPALHPILSNGMNSIVRKLVNKVISTFLETGKIKIPGIGGAVLLESTNYFNTTCIAPPKPAHFSLLNWQQNPIILGLNALIDSTVGNWSSPYSMNQLMRLATNNTGHYEKWGEVINISMDDKASGSFSLKIDDLYISGLDSFYELAIMEPETPQSLLFDIALGHCTKTKCNPFELMMNVYLDYEGLGANIHTNYTVGVGATNLRLGTLVDLAISNGMFWNVKMSDLANGGSCFMSYIDTLSVDELNITLSKLAFLTPNATVDWSKVDKVSQLVVDGIATFVPLVLQQVNKMISTKLDHAVSTCDGDSSGGKNTKMLYTELGVGFGAALFLIAGVTLARRHFKSQGEKSTKQSLVLVGIDEEEPPSTCMAHMRTALHNHREVPRWARFFVILGLMGTVALFISAHTSVGATVSLRLAYGSTQLFHLNLFEFTLTNSVRDMWDAKVYALSLLIAICSGGWPYLKTILLACCWLIPRNFLHQHKRARLLTWLDVLGKWSLIDAYVLVLFVVAFRFHCANPDFILPSDVAAADVIVLPGWGIYGFIMAAILQLILTHVIIHFHREAEGKHSHMREITSGAKESVRAHTYHSAHGKVTFKCTLGGQIGSTFMLVLSVLMVALGLYLTSFTFDFEGAAGVLLQKLNTPAHRSYSVLSLGNSVSHSTGQPHDPGVLFLQATFFVFVVGVPLLYLVNLLVLWSASMSIAVQRGVFITAEVLNAWGSLEVFVISIIASILEIGQFAKFIVGDKCDQVNVFLKELAELFPGFYPSSDSTECFSVATTLNNGCWVLFGASLIVISFGFLVLRSCMRALEERILSLTFVRDSLPPPDEGSTDSSDETGTVCSNKVRILETLGIVEVMQGLSKSTARNRMASTSHLAVPLFPEH